MPESDDLACLASFTTAIGAEITACDIEDAISNELIEYIHFKTILDSALVGAFSSLYVSPPGSTCAHNTTKRNPSDKTFYAGHKNSSQAALTERKQNLMAIRSSKIFEAVMNSAGAAVL